MKRCHVLFLLLCVLAFILGKDLGVKAVAGEAPFKKATALANELKKPVRVDIPGDPVIHLQLPTVRLWEEFYDEKGNFKCPDPKREKGESKGAWFIKWATIVVPYVEGNYGDIITEASTIYRIDRYWIVGKIVVESCGDPNNVSPAGAKGLMQLMDDTAVIVDVEDPFNPRENIMGGTRYVRYLVDKFGDVDTAMAAYNIGETIVRARLRGGEDFSEYRYVVKVKTAMNIAKKM